MCNERVKYEGEANEFTVSAPHRMSKPVVKIAISFVKQLSSV